MTVFALLDCNNFYASCERLFNPSLKNKAIIVLSNNDGCIIARSNEAKALGIPMGEPYYKAKRIIESNDVAVFSSNYTLYGDMSRRVMQTVAHIVEDIEIYSIDEVFIDLTDFANPEEVARKIYDRVSTWTGIPVSIGIGSSKTLAKLANKVAKKYKSYGGVFYIDNDERRKKVLKSMPVSDVWGIGRRISPKLNELGIKTAFDLSLQNDAWVRKFMSITGLKTVEELRGKPCIMLEPIAESKKSIIVSRSFGGRVFEKDTVKTALANFVERAAQKLRNEGLLAKEAYISLYRELSASGVSDYKDTAFVSFDYPTDSTLELMKYISHAFEGIYKPNHSYKKCGITIYKMQAKNKFVKDLFDGRDLAKQDSLMQTIDLVNKKHGSGSIMVASANGNSKWVARKDKKSFCYTTRWDELPCVS